MGAPRQRVLVVDDNADVRTSVVQLLELAGFEAEEAADGAGAVLLAEAFRPQVALIDISLPDIDGFEVARRLRAASGGRSMVLIAVSGYGFEDCNGRARLAGFDDQVMKPVHPDRLDSLIRRSLDELAPLTPF